MHSSNLTYHITLLAAALVAALALTACHDDPKPAPDQASGMITFGMGTTVGWEAASQSRADASDAADAAGWGGCGQSRSGGPIEANMPASIGMFGYNNDTSHEMGFRGMGEVFNNREVFYIDGVLYPNSGIPQWYENNKWPYIDPQPWIMTKDGDPVDYKFFAYSPYAPSSDVAVEGTDYQTFQYFSWYHIPKFSETDYVVSTGIRQYQSVASGNPEQPIEMEHLLARLRFCFALGEKFSRLRQVHVKSMEIIRLLDHKWTMNMDMSGATPVKTWVQEPTTNPELTSRQLWNESAIGDDGLLHPIEKIILNEDNRTVFQPLASAYILPYEDLSALTIRVRYDVYDNYGQLLRADEEAENQISLNYKSYNSPGSYMKLRPGYYYDIKITIEPKFLYSLSDNDQKPDGFVVVPE